MSVVDWRDVKYNEVYTDTLMGLERIFKDDPSYDISNAEGILKDLYIQDGNDWLGRGEVEDVFLEATIAAYETFIARWKARIGSVQKEQQCP